MDNSRPRPDNLVNKKPPGPGVGSPFAGESSSSNLPVPDDDAATICDPLPQVSDPEATLVDFGPPGSPPVPYRPRPTPSPIPRRQPSAAVFEIGDLLGNRYEILQLLGEGGMGAVYKASDRELDRFIALKVIRPEMVSNPS